MDDRNAQALPWLAARTGRPSDLATTNGPPGHRPATWWARSARQSDHHNDYSVGLLVDFLLSESPMNTDVSMGAQVYSKLMGGVIAELKVRNLVP